MVEPRKQTRGDARANGMDQQRNLAAEDWTNHEA